MPTPRKSKKPRQPSALSRNVLAIEASVQRLEQYAIDIGKQSGKTLLDVCKLTERIDNAHKRIDGIGREIDSAKRAARPAAKREFIRIITALSNRNGPWLSSPYKTLAEARHKEGLVLCGVLECVRHDDGRVDVIGVHQP